MKEQNSIWELKELMHDLSEDMWFAQWYENMNGEDISILLWEAITKGRKIEGMAKDLTREGIRKLKDLHEKAGGWWAFVMIGKSYKYIFMPTEDWIKYYEEYKGGTNERTGDYED